MAKRKLHLFLYIRLYTVCSIPYDIFVTSSVPSTPPTPPCPSWPVPVTEEEDTLKLPLLWNKSIWRKSLWISPMYPAPGDACVLFSPFLKFLHVSSQVWTTTNSFGSKPFFKKFGSYSWRFLCKFCHCKSPRHCKNNTKLCVFLFEHDLIEVFY